MAYLFICLTSTVAVLPAFCVITNIFEFITLPIQQTLHENKIHYRNGGFNLTRGGEAALDQVYYQLHLS